MALEEVDRGSPLVDSLERAAVDLGVASRPLVDALVAGGGMPTGQVIGATDRLGGEPTERPVHFGEVFATIYHRMGIDINQPMITDFTGRPHYLVDGHKPMPELV